MGEQRGTRVYVGNLTDKVKKDDLECEFTKYGKLNSVWIAFNPPGFAFIEFEHRDDAEKACDVLNGSELLGSQLRVEISKGRPRQGGRRGGGGFRSDRRGSGGRDYGRRDYGSGGYRRDSGGSGGGRYRDRGYGGGGGGGGGGSGRSNYGSSGGRNNYGSSGRSNYGGRDGFSKMKNARNPEDRGYSSGGGGGSGRYRSRSPANHRF